MKTAQTDNKDLVKFEADNGEMVKFTSDDVKKLICPQASEKDIALFMAMCQNKRLDPIGSKDAYLVGYNTKDGFRTSMITSYHVFNRRASANPDYDGVESGVIVLNKNTNKIYDKVGTAFFPEAGEQLLGAYARVFFKSKSHPVEERVRLDEYTTHKSNWASMPGTMIEKVAKAKAWRTAFPDDFQGLYEASEMEQATEPQQATPQRAEVIEVVAAEPVQEQVTEQVPQQLDQAQQSYLQNVAEKLAAVRLMSYEDAKKYIVDTLGNPVGKDWNEYKRFCGELLKQANEEMQQTAAQVPEIQFSEPTTEAKPAPQPAMAGADIQF